MSFKYLYYLNNNVRDNNKGKQTQRLGFLFEIQ